MCLSSLNETTGARLKKMKHSANPDNFITKLHLAEPPVLYMKVEKSPIYIVKIKTFPLSCKIAKSRK